MRIVPRLGLILHVRRVDRDAPRLLLRRRINLVVGLRLPSKLLDSTVVIAAVNVVLP